MRNLFTFCKPERLVWPTEIYSLKTFSLHVVISCVIVFGLLLFFPLDIIADSDLFFL